MHRLYIRIEELRDVMHQTALKKGISHPEVLQVSQTIDLLIIQYYEMNYKLKKSS